MAEHEDFYTPEHIDEQVDALLQARSMPDQDLRMAQDLRIVLKNADAQADAHSLQRVLHQLMEDKHSTHTPSDEVIPSVEQMQQQKHGRIIHMNIAPAKKLRPVTRVFTTVAAGLVVAALVGSMLLLTYVIHQKGNTITGSAKTSSSATHPQGGLSQGIYTSSTTAVFKLTTQNKPQVIWRQTLPDALKIIPAGNVVYILQSRNNPTINAVLELDASTGKILWKHAFTQPNNANLSGEITDLVFAQNRLYVNWAITTNLLNPAGDAVYVLNALTGGQVSVYNNSGLIWNAMDANASILATGGTNVQVYNATTHKLLWQASMAGVVADGPTVVQTLKIVNNLIYVVFSNNSETVGDGKSYIAVYQAATGKQVWQSPIFPGDALYHFAIDQNIVYFGTLSAAKQPFTSRVYAYNMQSNKQLWSTPVNGSAQEPFIVSNGTVYTAVDPGASAKVSNGTVYKAGDPGAPANSRLVALDAATGAIKWQQTLDTIVLDSFGMSNGILYTGYSANLNTANPTMGVEAFSAAGQKLWESTQYGSNIVPTA